MNDAYSDALATWKKDGGPRPANRPDGIPTRVDQLWRTDAERAIAAAMAEVEQAGASVALTDAVTLLGQARDRVADHVEGVVDPAPVEENRMVQIDKLIANMQAIRERFGNTCCYIRRHGLSWGAVALNYRDDDQRLGVFDLQAAHDRQLVDMHGQIERLIADRNEWRERAVKAEVLAERAAA